MHRCKNMLLQYVYCCTTFVQSHSFNQAFDGSHNVEVALSGNDFDTPELEDVFKVRVTHNKAVVRWFTVELRMANGFINVHYGIKYLQEQEPKKQYILRRLIKKNCSYLEILWEKSSSKHIRRRQNHKIIPYGFHFWVNYTFKNHTNLILIFFFFFV